jgi:DNA-binding transcriptional LysR family regulator
VLDLGQLHVLSAVADRGSMSGAAAYLSYTPSAVSQKIAALERNVGIGLVERGAHGTSLTEAGRTLVRHAHDIFARLAAAEQELGEMVGLRTGTLRLGAFATAAAVLVPPALTSFRRVYPSVEVSICELEPEQAVARLHAREIDLALVYEFPAAPGPPLEGLDCEYLFDDPLYVALPQEHPLARRDRLKLADLTDETWICGVQRDSTLEVLTASGYQPWLALRTDGHMAVQGCVAAGQGVAMVPRLALPMVRRDVALRALDDDDLLARRVGLTVTAGPFRPSCVTAMMEILRHISRRVADPLTALDRAAGGEREAADRIVPAVARHARAVAAASTVDDSVG